MRDLKGATIVFLNNFRGPGLGGGEVHLLHLICACRDAGMSVHVICEPGGVLEEEARSLGVRVASYRLGRRNLVRTVSRVRKYLKRYQADIVHSTGFLTNIISRLAARMLKTRIVNAVHCDPHAPGITGEPIVVRALRRTLEAWTRRRPHLVLAVSGQVAETLVAGGYPADRVHVIHNAVDVVVIEKTAHAEPPVEFVDVANDGPVVGTVARLEPVKGVDVFIEMAGELAARVEDVRFWIVGDGAERSLLEAAARDLGLQDRLAFLGVVSPAIGLIKHMDILVVASRSEGLPTVVLEAMALGVPVVATRVGGLSEVIADSVTGLLVSPEDPAALASAVGSLLEDPDRAVAMGKAGRLRALDHFNLSSMIAAHLREYRRLIN